MTLDPSAQADSAASGRAIADPPPDGPLPAVASIAPGPRRGYRARPADEIFVLIGGLAQQVAGAADQALLAHNPEAVTLITTPVAGWYPMLAAALLQTAPPSHVPVRGITDVITAAAAVPPALGAMGPMAHGLARWIRSLSFSERSPLLTEAELGGLWLDAVVSAMLQPGPQQRRRKIRVVGLGRAQPVDSFYLLSVTAAASLIWRPRRWFRKSPDAALAQWLLMTADGDVLGGGIEKRSP